ncbi:MAG: c-type cytochrome domain-containing protein [Bacteroidota bacterium]
MKRKWLISAAILLGLGLSLGLIAPFRNWILNNVGRYHVLVLHFPIGLLWMALLMEMAGWLGIRSLSREAVGFVLGVGTLTAVAAAVTGWILHFEGGYAEELLEMHEKMGFVTAFLAVLTYGAHRLGKQKWYMALLILTAGFVTWAGHLGGSLTHGEGFLTENLGNTKARGMENGEVVAYEEARVFKDLIRPIFAAKCLSCHNAGKKKGGLALADSAAILMGGEHGGILGKEKGEMSELVRVIRLDEADEMHMPPAGKAQLTAQEIDWITWWVESGAPFSKRVAEVPGDAALEESLRRHFAPVHPLDRLGISTADPNTLQNLLNQGYRITRDDPTKPWLTVNLSDEAPLSLERLENLSAVAPQISTLDLGNTALSSEHLAWANDLPHLRHLKLDQCQLDATTFSELTDLPYLESLNLYQTQLQALENAPIDAFPSLKKLYTWQSGLPKSTLDQWQAALPNLQIESGSPESLFPEQAIIPPTFSATSPFFQNTLHLALNCAYPGAAIHFTTDGTAPSAGSPRFQDTLKLKATTTLHAQSYLDGWLPSPVVRQSFVRVLPAARYRLAEKPDAQYPGPHPQALIDLKTGTTQFTDPNWMGFWGRDCRVTLELPEADTIHGIAVHALEAVKSWIFFPKKITLKAGLSPTSLRPLATEEFALSQEDQEGKTHLFTLDTAPIFARFLQIEIQNFGQLPAWHDAAGQDAWLFLDEIGVF